MVQFLIRRILYMIPTLFLISILVFVIIQLPPGDYLSTLIVQMEESGESVDQAQIDYLRERYGLDQPIWVQYWQWITGIIFHLDFGHSFEWGREVSALIADRLPLTIGISLVTVVFTWAMALPIGIYSAVKQYSAGDYVFTTIGFLGVATPNFLLALIMMWAAAGMGMSVGSASPAMLVVAVIVLGTAGTAGLIRVMRANLLDELKKPYVVAARARGIPQRRRLIKYPVRVALNPFVSSIGWLLPTLISGEVIVSTVMNLDTTGPLLLQSLRGQDMYLAGSIILISAVFTVIGTLLSDLALAWLDPRIRIN
ncbi:ABC transporter permease [Ruania alba]|uniref:Peptide/nickel transport system permease protein n=1 Tax=Ruania alba TaxID=648782 RepID=A0A1H5BMC4_9MICO|nr:ABC transporter permease [Ruania alba]SED55516.1 peptide/nickel transport system permease protein [Ruania alba]